MRRCETCQHGEINYWGYRECWKFERRLDTRVTDKTAVREQDAEQYNPTNTQCMYHISKRFKFIRRLLCKHDSIRFVRNLYGDEIVESNGCRSLWECDACGLPIYRDNFVPGKGNEQRTGHSLPVH